MDATRFDAFVRSLTGGVTRRGLSRALAGLGAIGGLSALLGSGEAEAKKKRKKKKKCKGKRKCGKKCVPKSGCCTDADCGSGGKVCVGNVCTCPDTCPPDHIANPETCACCRLNGVLADECAADPCCSDLCSPAPGEMTICFGRELGDPCSFDEQCASPLTCNPNLVCA